MNAQVGNTYIIERITDPLLEARLVSMGIFPGKQIKVIAQSLWGGAYYLEVEACRYAFREDEVGAMQLSKVITASGHD